MRRPRDGRHLLDAVAQGRQCIVGRRGGGIADPRRRPVLPKDSSEGSGPLAGGRPRGGGGERGGHDVDLRVSGRCTQCFERGLDGGGVAGGAPRGQRVDGGGLDGGIDREDAAVLAGLKRRGLRLRVHVLADHLEVAALDPLHARPVRLHHLRLHVRHRRHRAALLGHHGHLLARARHQLVHQPVHHLRALEDVGVLEQVGLVGEDLLDPQRPLLVPRPRQPQGLVPGRQLQRPRPRLAAHRDRQRLEHDPDDVVLRLRLGQPERVHLHPVAEAQQLLVVHAVALAADLLPEPAHRAQLRVLLDEANAGVDEERDAPEHPREGLVRHALRARGRAPPAPSRARTRSPAPAWPRPPGGGTSRC